MKKTIAFVSALAMVFCCSFPAFATTPTGRRREASYDYGDVSLHVSVDAGASVTYNNDVCHYDHRFTVTLTNKTNSFQVADQNLLAFKLYTGRNDYFDNTFIGSSGTTQTNASWGAEVTSYSDNMTVPDIKFYTSTTSGWEGSVYIKFNDSELLVLNPNETRTYNFTIDFIASQTTGAMPINGNYVYGYFTYLSNSSISIFSKPNNFTSNTIDQFLENDSFPNSAIAWLMASYEQGVVDQEKYDEIISILMSKPSNISYGSYTSGIFAQNYSVTLKNDSFFTQSYASICRPVPLDTDFNYNGLDFSNVSLNESSVYVVPTYIEYRIANRSSTTYSSPSGAHWFHIPISSILLDQGYYYGSDYEVILSDGLTLLNLGDDIYFGITEHVDNNDIITAGAYYRCIIKVNRYFVINKTGDNITRPNNVYINNFTPTNYSIPSFTVYNQTIYQSIRKTLSVIRDKIQSILDSYDANSSAAEDVTDSAESSSSTIDNQHQSESNYFSDSQSAIQDTGIQNFQFSPQELGGLNGLKDDFTAVWVSCGTLSRVWITSLTIGLALAIIRHRRMFEK